VQLQSEGISRLSQKPQNPVIAPGDRVYSFGVEQNFEKFKANKTLDAQIQNSGELDKLIEKQDLA
jgi:hypothetical protein